MGYPSVKPRRPYRGGFMVSFPFSLLDSLIGVFYGSVCLSHFPGALKDYI